MKPIFYLLFPFLVLLAACQPAGVAGTGTLLNDIRTVPTFDRVESDLPGKIIVHMRSNYSVEVQIEESLMPHFKCEVSDGRLYVGFIKAVKDVDNLVVHITAPQIVGFDMRGSADLLAQETLSGDQLQIDLSGSGSLEATQVAFNSVDARISGSGKIILKGQVYRLDAELDGSGNMNTLACPVDEAVVQVGGSGQVHCRVGRNLKATVTGSGEIGYQGEPTVVSEVTGSGRVRKL